MKKRVNIKRLKDLIEVTKLNHEYAYRLKGGCDTEYTYYGRYVPGG